jgi:hypothetical protein
VFDASEADRVDARHHAGAAGAQHRVVPAQHVVDAAGDVDRVHRHAAEAVGMLVQHRRHGLEPGVEGRVRRVGDQLVVLEEVDAGGAEIVYQRRRLRGGEADARLDDRADQRPARDAGEPPRAVDAELRVGEGRGVRLRQVEVEQAQAGDLAELEQVARDRGVKAGQVGPDVVDRKRDLDLGPVEHAAVRPARDEGAGQGRLEHGRQRVDAHHPRPRARLQRLGFAGQREEGAARLLAGNDLRDLVRGHGALDEIAGAELGTRRERQRRGRHGL